ncbi:MAG: PAS domain S-box protein [Zoogloeaceae bacterium]|nr:PAS domain S-box protein [Zoogloeaceae bacterium]
MDSSPQPAAHASHWATRLPYAALVLFVLLIGALLWLTRLHDEDNQRHTLISDALWMEQSLQFQLDRNAAQLAQLGPELVVADIAPQTDARLRQMLRAENGLTRIVWLDVAGNTLGVMPPLSSPPLSDTIGLQAVIDPDLSRLARTIGRPVYGPIYPAAGGGHQFEVHIPAFSDAGLLGISVGVYSLESLLARELPWWFTEKYRVSVTDSEGRVVTTRARVAPLSNTLTYTMSFDPPGHGLLLQITAYRGDIRWIPVILMTSILALGGILLWSFWQLRLQLKRRLAAEDALRGETLFRKAMEDSLLTGLRARDLAGRITYVNPAFCNMVGFSAQELIGLRPPMPYWHPDHIERLQEIHDMILSGQGPRAGVEVKLRRKNGEELDALIFEAPLIDASGRQTGWMGSIMDITERKRARELARQQDERLQATSRLITMGEMASTLAHELNQPLAAINTYNSGCLNLLEEGYVDPIELREIHEKIARQAYRAAAIIHRVHDFVRRSEPKRERIALNDVVREAIDLMDADVRKRQMRIALHLAPGMPPLTADPVMIEQLVVNLVRNGMDAVTGLPAERRVVTVATQEKNGNLVLRVSDRGPGIPPDLAKRLFEPFFSTKQEGMGMGLNICRSIAELHHGRLAFEAAPHGGAVFILTLPVEMETTPA